MFTVDFLEIALIFDLNEVGGDALDVSAQLENLVFHVLELAQNLHKTI